MVYKTVPEIDHEIAHKIEPEIPLENLHNCPRKSTRYARIY